jgi:intein/homing endonuclease
LNWLCGLFGCDLQRKFEQLEKYADRLEGEKVKSNIALGLCQERASVLLKQVRELLKKKDLLEEQLVELKEQGVEDLEETEEENFFNSKHEKKKIEYAGRSFPINPKMNYSIDVRYFLTPAQPIYEIVESNKLNAGSNDEKALKCLKWVMHNISYMSDKEVFGSTEYWSTDFETLSTKKGDCVTENEEIITKKGIKKIKDIKKGELVLSYDFEKKEYCYKPVKEIWDKGIKKVKRVHFRNGSTIDVTEEHPLWVRTNQKHSKYEKKYLKDIDLTKWWKRKVPVAKKIPYQSEDSNWLTKNKCFIIGHYIAEGWEEKSHICTSGYDCPIIAEKLEKEKIPFGEGKNGNGVPIIRFHKSKFKDFLKGILKNSFEINLPNTILNLPEEKLKAFLDGYFLGDGGNLEKYVDKRGFKKSVAFYYSTSSDQLAKDLVLIHLRLGKPIYSWKCKNHKGKGNKPIWRLFFNPNSNFLKDYGYKGLSESSISYIEDIGKQKTKDIQIKDTATFFFRNGICSHNCDSGSILLHNLMVASKIPYYRIRLNAGSVAGGGNAYITYFREHDNQAVVLDWCYWSNTKPVKDRKLHKDERDYYGIWFSSNKKHSFGEIQTMSGLPDYFKTKRKSRKKKGVSKGA